MAPTEMSVLQILAEAKILAQRYRKLTGKPLGITGEVAEYEASRILGIHQAVALLNGVVPRLPSALRAPAAPQLR